MPVRIFGALFAICIVSGSLAAQQVRTPEIPLIPPVQELGVIWDMADTNSFSRSVQTTVENGVKKTRAVENNLKAYIEEDPAVGITMKVTRQYGPQDSDALIDNHPELSMYFQAIPSEVGDLELEVTLGVTTRYEATDADDLKERHPDAFEIYRKFTSPQINVQSFRGGFRAAPEILMPERIRPGMRFEIDPRGIRVHNEENDDDEDDDKSSDAKNDQTDKKKDDK